MLVHAAQAHCQGEEGTCGAKTDVLLQIRGERARKAVVLEDSSGDAEEEDQESSVDAKYALSEKEQGCSTDTMVIDESECKEAAEALQLEWDPEDVVIQERPGGCYAIKGKKAYFNSELENGNEIWKKAQGICSVPGPSPTPQASSLTCPNEIRCCSDSHDPKDIEITKDVIYGEALDLQGNPETLLLDQYEPKQRLNKLPIPAVVYIHGGSFKPSSEKKSGKNICKAWAQRDFFCVSIEYRRWGPPLKSSFSKRIKAPAEDAWTAVRYLVKNSEKFSIDVNNIGMMGNSAGGLTTSAATILDAVESGSHLEHKSNVSFAVSMAGGLPPEWKKKWKFDSIKDAGIPPYLGIHYTKDKLVSYDNAKYTQELLDGLDISNELLTFDGKGHTPDLQENGFFNDKLFDDVVGFVLRNTYIADCQLVPE
jgi:acetyl esterase/lipase